MDINMWWSIVKEDPDFHDDTYEEHKPHYDRFIEDTPTDIDGTKVESTGTQGFPAVNVVTNWFKVTEGKLSIDKMEIGQALEELLKELGVKSIYENYIIKPAMEFAEGFITAANKGFQEALPQITFAKPSTERRGADPDTRQEGSTTDVTELEEKWQTDEDLGIHVENYRVFLMAIEEAIQIIFSEIFDEIFTDINILRDQFGQKKLPIIDPTNLSQNEKDKLFQSLEEPIKDIIERGVNSSLDRISSQGSGVEIDKKVIESINTYLAQGSTRNDLKDLTVNAKIALSVLIQDTSQLPGTAEDFTEGFPEREEPYEDRPEITGEELTDEEWRKRAEESDEFRASNDEYNWFDILSKETGIGLTTNAGFQPNIHNVTYGECRSCNNLKTKCRCKDDN